MTKEKLSEASDTYIPPGYILPDIDLKEMEKHKQEILAERENHRKLIQSKCPHGVYKVQKVGTQWQIVCTKCESTHISPEELDEISDWMNSLCRGA